LTGSTATITAGAINNGSSDNCDATLSLSLSKSAFDCSDVGNNTVTLVVTDDFGNEADCTATVTIKDRAVSITDSLDDGNRLYGCH
jgi:hypothetical protein